MSKECEWQKNCAEIKEFITDNADEDATKIVSHINDILDNAFGLNGICDECKIKPH